MSQYTENEPLHRAVEFGQVERVRELLLSGVKVDNRDPQNVTPLMVAARLGFDEIVELLIESGAKVNAKDRASSLWIGKRSPLHYACGVGRVRTARILLENGADPDCADQLLATPLSNALAGANHPLAECLLGHGANPNGPEKCWSPPIVAAAGRNDIEMIRKLLAMGADPNRMGEGGNLALAETCSVECADELLRHGAGVNLTDAGGLTPLYVNVVRGTLELLKCYVEAGADVNVKDKDGVTVLMAVSNEPRIGVAEMLVAAGADVNALPWPKCSLLDSISNSTSHYKRDERRSLAEFLRGKGAKTAKELSGHGSIRSL